MKKLLALTLAAMMLLSLAACGGKTEEPADNTPVSDITENTDTTDTTEEQSNTTDEQADTTAEQQDAAAEQADTTPEQQNTTVEISSADGTLTVSAKDIAVVVNGTAVPMPYHLGDLESAGVPADESRSEIELGAGDFFSANLYLDENEDYLLIPAYYNEGDSAISITEAEAEEITMTTYADEPQDQGVSIFGVSFGMARSEVKALLGDPMSDDGDYFEWHVEVPDMDYEGTLSMYITADADDAGVSQIDLTVFPK